MYRIAAPRPPESPREWQLIVEAYLYEHLGVPEAWLARVGGTVALLLGARVLVPEAHGEQRAQLFDDLRRVAGEPPPLLAPSSFGLERVYAPGDAEAALRHVAVCPWPDAAGMTLGGIARYLPGSRFDVGAAVEVAAQLARVRLAVPHTDFTHAGVIVFESGEVRVAPPLPETERSASLSYTGLEYLDALGMRASPFAAAEPGFGVASALFELVTGLGEAGAEAKRRFMFGVGAAQQPALRRHPLPSDLGVYDREVDALVARGTSGEAPLPELAQALAALSQALDGAAALGRAVRASVAAATAAPPHERTHEGRSLYMLFPDVQALPDGAGWPGAAP
ncbi:hypothetical protein WME99_28990 [Sorangium sp. So ce136]|uniref:hypothetical protein n=1 Tax=Sorangium sp. So ce136 TaxID=3133284 RepID=UPI003F04414C